MLILHHFLDLCEVLPFRYIEVVDSAFRTVPVFNHLLDLAF